MKSPKQVFTEAVLLREDSAPYARTAKRTVRAFAANNDFSTLDLPFTPMFTRTPNSKSSWNGSPDVKALTAPFLHRTTLNPGRTGPYYLLHEPAEHRVLRRQCLQTPRKSRCALQLPTPFLSRRGFGIPSRFVKDKVSLSSPMSLFITSQYPRYPKLQSLWGPPVRHCTLAGTALATASPIFSTVTAPSFYLSLTPKPAGPLHLRIYVHEVYSLLVLYVATFALRNAQWISLIGTAFPDAKLLL